MKKLLALDLTATTAKMLEVCRTHIAISNNLDALDLVGSKPVHAIHQGKHTQATSTWSKTTWKSTPMWELHEVTPTWTIIMPGQGLNLQQVREGWTLEAKMSRRSTQGTTTMTQQRRK